jgi:hypothetical protein
LAQFSWDSLSARRTNVRTLEAAQTRIAKRLKSAADCIYELLRRPNVLCAEEMGARAAGKNYWIHVLCDGKAAHYVLREKRGKEGRQDRLADYDGV